MRAALDAVEPRLRACGSAVGGISLEFATAADRDRLAGFTVVGQPTASVERCVQEVLDEVRFAPTEPRTFLEVYLP